MDPMVALTAAQSVVQGLGHLSSLAEGIAEDWYEASQELQDFQDLQSNLKSKADRWKEAVRSEGMSDDDRLREPLHNAIKCLEGERIRMDTAVSHCCLFRILSFFKPHPFPPFVKDSMKRVVDAFDHIHDLYREASEPARVVEQLADTRVDPRPITVDPRWVKLTETHDKVMRLLGEKSEKKVVTLYGGAGSGKTTLATQVAQYYQENRTTFTDGARFFSCGRDATVDSICKELFQSLGMDVYSAPDQSSLKAEQGLKAKGGAAPTSEGPALVKKLARRLRERSLLIVLDDVTNSDLLREKLVVRDAREVKYLITSLRRDIYDGAALVHMQRPSEQEAQQILVNFIPNSPRGDIPDELQGKADEIIQKADWVPGILARVGAQIDIFDDGPSWDAALNDFTSLFQSSERTDKLGVSMLMAVDALDGNYSDAKKLLYLLAMCELDQHVPEEVLELLYRRIDSKHLSTFKRYKKILKDRDLILVVEKKGWVLSNNYRLLILKNKKEDVSEVLLTLLKENNDDDDDLVQALCILFVFFEKDDFTSAAALAIQETAKKFGIPLEDRAEISSMREAIYNLLHLLSSWKGAIEGGECEIRRHRLASKVIKQFISKQDLDESFVQLLGEKDIFEGMCQDLKRMAYFTNDSKEKPLLTKETLSLTLEELTFKLNLTSMEIVTTMDTLSALSQRENCDLILDNDHVLTSLLEILHSQDQDEKQLGVINSTLKCLSALAKSLTAREKIVSFEGLLEVLITIYCKDCDLTKSKNVMVKVDAIGALGSIALHKTTSNSLVKTPNLLSNMAKFLEDIYFKDQGYFGDACSTIDCLLSLLRGNDANKGDICKHEHLICILSKIFEIENSKYIGINNFEGDLIDYEDVVIRIIPVLTMIDPTKYNKVKLYSNGAYISRGKANIFCGLYKEAFEDYKNADYMDNLYDGYYKFTLCFLKAKLKDFKGALHYAKWGLDENPNDPYYWQEFGVLKELMEDYEGAKLDLTKSLGLASNDYECLKHRAYVNFKLGCEEEAHEDAKKALQVFSERPLMHAFEIGYNALGFLPVQFLDYNLK